MPDDKQDNSDIYPQNNAQQKVLQGKKQAVLSNNSFYFVDDIIDLVIDYYTGDESEKVKKLFNDDNIKYRFDVRAYMREEIRRRNRQIWENQYKGNVILGASVFFPATISPVLRQNDPALRSEDVEKGLFIPKNMDFFKQVFPRFLVRSGTSLTTVTIDKRVLEALSFNDELETIAADNETKQIDAFGTSALHEIESALRGFGVSAYIQTPLEIYAV